MLPRERRRGASAWRATRQRETTYVVGPNTLSARKGLNILLNRNFGKFRTQTDFVRIRTARLTTHTALIDSLASSSVTGSAVTLERTVNASPLKGRVVMQNLAKRFVKD